MDKVEVIFEFLDEVAALGNWDCFPYSGRLVLKSIDDEQIEITYQKIEQIVRDSTRLDAMRK